MSDIYNIVVDPEARTVAYNLNGDRTKDSTMPLTKIYSVNDSPHLKEAVDDLVWFYESKIKE